VRRSEGPAGGLLGVQAPETTDSGGRYEIANVPPGTYLIQASYTVLREMIGKTVPPEFLDCRRRSIPRTATRISQRGSTCVAAMRTGPSM